MILISNQLIYMEMYVEAHCTLFIMASIQVLYRMV
jgi:hypothetical protein